jgi:frataxin-like iron-binding protein CyaY
VEFYWTTGKEVTETSLAHRSEQHAEGDEELLLGAWAGVVINTKNAEHDIWLAAHWEIPL